MDRSIFEAAWSGNLESLLKLIEDDPGVLGAVALSGGETPLHIACLAGHQNFVQELLKLSIEFAGELNQDGLSPLHIASAKGHAGIVKEIIKVDHNLCLLKGRERRVPLHYAAFKGRVQVIRDLLSANADSIAEVTTRGETALHLTVENNQYEALRVLLEHLKHFNKEDILNKKDDQGNTMVSKSWQVVDLLLNEHVVTKGAMEVNPLNKRGLKPLDILLSFQSEAGDREIEEILRRAGAMTAIDLHSLHENQDAAANNNPSNDQSRNLQPRSPSKQLLEFFKYDEIKDSPSKVRNTLLVIAILIVTATYQAVLSPPGGVWQDDFGSNSHNGTNTTAAHTAGKAVMGYHNCFSYCLFLLFNSIGFFTSLDMINILPAGFPLRLELQVSMVALIVTYDTCMFAIAPCTGVTMFFTVISAVMPFFVPIAALVVRNHLRKPLDALPCTNLASA